MGAKYTEFDYNEANVKVDLEAIKQHEVDESLGPVDRALHLIKKGSDAQRVSVLHHLPQLITSQETERISRELIPCIFDLARGGSGRSKIFHQAASDSVSQVICQLGRNIHPTVLNMLLNFAGGNIVNPDQAIAEIWINTLLTVMESVPKKVVQSVILPAAANAAWHDEQQRIYAAVIFGKMCSLPGGSELRDAVIPKLMVLCHDPEWRVRAAACQQFVYATHSFASSPKLISEFLALGGDESEEVRAAVISSAAMILSGQHAHIVIQSMAPLIMSLAKESLRECSSVLIAVARHFGELSFALHSIISSDERKWLIFLYQNMTRMGLSRPADTLRHTDYLVTRDSQESIKWSQQIRTEVAFSFPKVVVFFQSENCVDVLVAVFRDLSRDPHIPVRCMFSKGLYEVMSSLHRDVQCLVLKDMVFLLNDSNIDVLHELVPNIAKLLSLLAEKAILATRNTSFEQNDAVTQVQRGLLACEGTVNSSLKWRLYKRLLTELEVLPKCLPSDIIYASILGRLLDRTLTVRPLVSRLAVSRTILVLLRFNERKEQREDIHSRLEEDLKKNHNSYHRKTYVWLCGNAANLFSRDYYKKWFFEKLVSLSEDPIATVRQLTIPVLLSMKKMCQGPTDRQLRNHLRNAFIRLSNDPDEQVRDCLNYSENQSDTVDWDITEDQRLLTEELAIEERQPPIRQSRDLPGTPHVRRAGAVVRRDPYSEQPTVPGQSYRSLSQPESQAAHSRTRTGYPGGGKERR